MKFLKKVLLISIILFIQFLTITYKIISTLWEKYNRCIKDFIKKLDNELRLELR